MLAHCPGEYPEDWDLPELTRQIQTVVPSRVTSAEMEECIDRDQLLALLTDDALEQYEAKDAIITAEGGDLREIERRVMLSMIDQHWREHLYEMDYLREGINLRAMGQRDPLAEWQREGYDMFEAMMASIEDNFVRYITRLQVVAEEPPPRKQRNLRYSSPEDPVQGSGALRAAAAGMPPPEFDGDDVGVPAAAMATSAHAGGDEEVVQQPRRVEKTPGRNEPCFCGSGKKYKFCHGR